MDANHDEKVDIQELTEFVRREHYAPEEMYDDKEKQEKRAVTDAKNYMEEHDANQDGFLDLMELTAHYSGDMTEVYASLADKDIDSAVDMDSEEEQHTPEDEPTDDIDESVFMGDLEKHEDEHMGEIEEHDTAEEGLPDVAEQLSDVAN